MQIKFDYNFTREIKPFGVIPKLPFILPLDLNLQQANSNCRLVNISCTRETLSKSYFSMKIIRLSASGSNRDRGRSQPLHFGGGLNIFFGGLEKSTEIFSDLLIFIASQS